MSLKSFTRPLRNLSQPVRRARNAWRTGKAYRGFLKDYGRFRSLSAASGRALAVRWCDRHPCLADAVQTTPFDRHYTYHTAWAARIVAQLRPSVHVDIASSLYFAAITSAFVPVQFFDYRPAKLGLSGLSSERADLTSLDWTDRSVASLSCMHVVEHIGLGRYGDPLDPEGDLKAMRELSRVLSPGGSLLFVVPVGQPRVCYNAHRVYGYEQILDAFSELQLRQFALVPDKASAGGLLIDADPAMVSRQRYGCGCFWLQRAL